MRRRQLPRDDGLPAELKTFELDRWTVVVERAPGPQFDGTLQQWIRTEALRAWTRARQAWAGEHGWPGGTVALIREHRVLRRQLGLPTPVEHQHDFQRSIAREVQ